MMVGSLANLLIFKLSKTYADNKIRDWRVKGLLFKVKKILKKYHHRL